MDKSLPWNSGRRQASFWKNNRAFNHPTSNNNRKRHCCSEFAVKYQTSSVLAEHLDVRHVFYSNSSGQQDSRQCSPSRKNTPALILQRKMCIIKLLACWYLPLYHVSTKLAVYMPSATYSSKSHHPMYCCYSATVSVSVQWVMNIPYFLE